jgi:hypothetical protein
LLESQNTATSAPPAQPVTSPSDVMLMRSSNVTPAPVVTNPVVKNEQGSRSRGGRGGGRGVQKNTRARKNTAASRAELQNQASDITPAPAGRNPRRGRARGPARSRGSGPTRGAGAESNVAASADTQMLDQPMENAAGGVEADQTPAAPPKHARPSHKDLPKLTTNFPSVANRIATGRPWPPSPGTVAAEEAEKARMRSVLVRNYGEYNPDWDTPI